MRMWTGAYPRKELMGQLMQYLRAKTPGATYFFAVVIIAGSPDKSK